MNLETLRIAFEASGHQQVAMAARRLQEAITQAMGRANAALASGRQHANRLAEGFDEAARSGRTLSAVLTRLATQDTSVDVRMSDLDGEVRSVDDLSQALTRLRGLDSTNIRVHVPGLAAETKRIRSLAGTLEKLERHAGPHNVAVHVSDVSSESLSVRRLTNALEKLQARTHDTNIRITVPDLTEESKAVRTLERALTRLDSASKDVRVRIDVPNLTSEANEVRTLSNALSRLDRIGTDGNVNLRVRVDIDPTSLAHVTALGHALKDLKSQNVRVNVAQGGTRSLGADGPGATTTARWKSVANAVQEYGQRAAGAAAKTTLLSGALVTATAAGAAFGAVTMGVAGGAAVGGLAALAGGALGVGAAFAIAGAGVGAFAILAVPSITKVKDRFDEYTQSIEDARVAQASGDWAAYDQALESQAEALAALTPLQRDTVTNMQRVKDAFESTAEAMEPTTLGMFNEALGVAHRLLPELRAVAEPVGEALTDVFARMQAGIEGASFQRFVQTVAAEAPGLIDQFATIGGNVGSAFSAAFFHGMPLIGVVMTGLVDQTDKLQAAFEGPGFRKFVDFAISMLPEVGQLLGALVDMFAALFSGLAPLVKPALDALTGLAAGLAAVFESPKMDAFVDRVIDLLPMVADTVLGLGDAFLSLLDAVSPLAGPALKTIGALAGALEALFQSEDAERFIAAIGELLPQLVGPLSTLGGAFMGFVRIVAEQLVNSNILGVLGDALETLAPAFEALATGGVAVLGALISGLLPPLSEILAALAGENGLGGLLTIIGTQLAENAPLFAALGEVIVAFLEGALPGILTLATAWEEALTPEVIQQVTDAILAMVDPATELGLAFADIATAIIPFLPDLIELGVAFVELLAPALELTATFVSALADGFVMLMDGPLGKHLVGKLDDLTGGLEAVTSALEWLTDLATDVQDSMFEFGQILGGVLEDIPGSIEDLFRDAGSWLTDAGADIIGGLVDGIESMALAPYRSMEGVLGKLSRLIPHSPALEGPFSGDGWTLHSGRAMLTDWAAGLDAAAPELRDRLAGHLGGLSDVVSSTITPDSPVPVAAYAMAGMGAGARAARTINVNAYINGAKPSSYPEGSPEHIAGDLFDEMVGAWQRGLAMEEDGGDW